MWRSTIFERSFNAMRPSFYLAATPARRPPPADPGRRAWSSILRGASPSPLDRRGPAVGGAVGAAIVIHEQVPVLEREPQRVRVLRLPQAGDAGGHRDAAHRVVHHAA